MTTKNLVPRANGEGKLGVKGDTDLNWKEVNAVTGSLDLGQIDTLHNQDGNNLIVGGTGITVSHASGSNGFEYTIDSSAGSPDQIIEGQAKVEAVDTGTDARIEFWVDPDDDGTSSKVWEISEDGHFLPATNADYDIGSAERKVRHLYLSDTTIKLGTSDNTAPFHFGVDANNNKFRVSVDDGLNFENIALSSDLYSYATQSFVTSQGFATETYVNDAIQGLDAKEAVDSATTGSLSGFTYSNNVFTESSATGALTIDGFVLSNGDRVLVKDEGPGNEVQHGIYVVSNIDGSSQVTLTRASDITHADSDADDFDGAFVFVQNGTDNAGRSYVAKPTTSGQTTVGTHGMTWVTFTSSNVTTLNSLSDVNASSPTDQQVLSWNDSSSEWQATDIPATSPTLVNTNTTLEENKDYVVDPSIVSGITLNVPNSGVSDGSQIHVTNLSTQSITIELYDTTGQAKLYYADGSLASTTSFYRTQIVIESQGTIRLYQSGAGDPVEWYVYHTPAFEIEAATSSLNTSEALVYSSLRKAFVNAGEIHGEKILSGNIVSDVKPHHLYATAWDESTARTISLPDLYNNADIVNDLNGKRIYFENRGQSTLTINLFDNYIFQNSVGYYAYLRDFDGVNVRVPSSGDNLSYTMQPGESLSVDVNVASSTQVYYNLGKYVPTSKVAYDTSAADASITRGNENQLTYVVDSAADVVITLPRLVDCKPGYLLNVKNVNTGNVRVKVDGSTSDVFDSTTSTQFDLSRHDSLDLARSESNWIIKSKDFAIGDFVVRGDSSSGSITLNCEQNTHGVTIQSPPHSAAATYTLTLPNTDGNADQVLKTDGSGNLDWVDQSSGGASTLSALTDVTTSSLESYDALYYDASTSTWLSGNLNSRSITTDSQNTYTFGNSLSTSHERVVTVSDFDNSVVFWPQAMNPSTTGTYIFTLPDVTGTGSSSLKAGQKIKIVTYGLDIDNHTIIIRPHDYSQTPSNRDTYIYPAGVGSVGSPSSPSVTLKKTSGFVEIEVYDTNYIHPNFLYSRSHTLIDELSNINVSSPSDNSVLTYDSTNAEWIDGQSLSLTGTISTSNTVTGSEMRLGGTARRFHTQSFSSTLGDGLSSQNTTSITSNDLVTVLNAGSLGLAIIPQANDGSNTYNGTLKLYDGGDNVGDDRHYIALATPGKLSSSTTYALPTDDGSSGDVLSTDGNGALSWSTVSGGSSSLPSLTTVSATSGTLAAPASDDLEKIYIFDSSNSLNWALPNINDNTISAGFKYNIKNIGTGQVTINGLAGSSTTDLIDGQSSITLSQYDSYTVVSVGSPGKDWYII